MRPGRGRLSYERAEYLFKQSTKKHDRRKGGFTLHQLRHSRLTHLVEDGWFAPMLMGLSGHTNIRSLTIYNNVTAEAVGAALPAGENESTSHRSWVYRHRSRKGSLATAMSRASRTVWATRPWASRFFGVAQIKIVSLDSAVEALGVGPDELAKDCK